MAALLQLIGGTAGTAVVSLLDDTALAVRSWAPQIAEASGIRMPQPVTESLTVRAYGATHDALATNVQNLVAMQKQAGDYTQDRAGTVPVWLRVQMNSETSARQALVRRIEITHADDLYSPPAKVGNTLNLGLAIEREPYWEGTAGPTLGGVMTQDTIPAAAASVVYNYGSVVGDAGARIAGLEISSQQPLGRIWAGLRSANKHGTLANFVPIWECEDTDNTLGTDSARATDTTASPGGTANTKVTVTPGTSTWANRLTLWLANVTANSIDNWGRYLWLLRHYVTSGDTWEAQLRFGYNGMPNANFSQGPIVKLSGTAWDYLEMGVGDIPFTDPYTSGIVRGDGANSAIQIWARRTAGTGVLFLDCLCPIPVDEGFLKAGAWNSAGSAPSLMYYQRSPRGSLMWTSAASYETAPWSEDNFYLPPGDGRLVTVYARNATSVLADQIKFNQSATLAGDYQPRWSSLRGSE